MWSRYMPIEIRCGERIRVGLRQTFGCLMAVWLALSGWAAQAQSLESVLAPGPVIASHAKHESECGSCHVRFNPKGQDVQCIACHKEVGQDFKAKLGYHGRLADSPSCRSCHTDHKGRDAQIVQFNPQSFDHQHTDYALRGKHQGVACQKCHLAGKKYRAAASTCLACHGRDDVHKGGLGGQCEDCHRETGWKELSFDHGQRTRFALTDKHAAVKCASCHANGRYQDTPRTCVGCHRQDDAHKGQYGAKCESCHDAKSWKTSTFNHDAQTKYPLLGRHRHIRCTDCHTGPLYQHKLGSRCWDCHRADDKHQESLGRECGSCHSESSWKDPPRFDHSKTRFPLLGKHAKVTCKSCHASALFKEAPKDCYACHKQDDKHAGTLGVACADCHSERDWKTTTGRFDHDRTRFPLRNAHAQAKLKCSACHASLKQFRHTDTACYACHKQDDKHEGTQGRECQQCHGDKTWRVTAFDHVRTRFPLTGRHQNVACQDCHASKRFKDAARECYACHLKADKHKLKFGERCEQCHNTRTWGAWDFNHTKQTHYPLTGRHARVACEACHTRAAPKGQAIADISSRCVSCHQAQDVHDGQFGALCEQCHSVTGWNQIKSRLGQNLDTVRVSGLTRLRSIAAAGYSSYVARIQLLHPSAEPAS